MVYHERKPERPLIASDKLADAARREGIEPGSPLWVWVEAQQHALTAIYEWQTNGVRQPIPRSTSCGPRWR